MKDKLMAEMHEKDQHASAPQRPGAADSSSEIVTTYYEPATSASYSLGYALACVQWATLFGPAQEEREQGANSSDDPGSTTAALP